MEEAKVFHPIKSKYIVFTSNYLLPLFICFGVIFLAYFILCSSFFKIIKVNCSLDSQTCEDPSLLAELDKLKGKNIFRISPSQITSRLTSGNFTIRQATLKRELPGIVILELESVYPVVALQIEGDSKWVIIDSKFRVIGTRSISPNVPTVLIPGPITLTVGKRIEDKNILKTLEISLRLADELFSLKSTTLVDAETIQLALTDGKTAIFTTKKDELTQLRVLQAILADATMTKGVKIIDVRFSQPVLR